MRPTEQPGSGQSSAPDRLEAALQASCEALIALELIHALARDELETHAVRAIESLRRAIAELRAARGEEPSALVHGFVIGRTPEGSPQPDPTDQSNR